jgi:hypothetical protein
LPTTPSRWGLLAVAVLVGLLGKHIGCIVDTQCGQAAKLRHITTFTGQFDKLRDSIATAAVGETPQLVHIASLPGQLDQLVNRVPIASRRAPA